MMQFYDSLLKENVSIKFLQLADPLFELAILLTE